MAKPKCKYCGAVIDDKDFAFVVQKGKQKTYYCTQEEYNKSNKTKSNNKMIYIIANRICGVPDYSPRLNKIVSQYITTHGIDKMISFFKDKEDEFVLAIERNNIASCNGKISFLDVCIKNSINDYYYAEPIDYTPIECEEVIELHKSYKPVTHKKCLADYFKEVET